MSPDFKFLAGRFLQNIEVVDYGISYIAAGLFGIASELNPWTQNERLHDIRPVLVGEYLYWAVEVDDDNADSTCVMEFDTRKELFELIPRPPCTTIKFSQYENINLLQSNGVLLFVQVNSIMISNGIIIDIWTLEDRANKIWMGIGTIRKFGRN